MVDVANRKGRSQVVERRQISEAASIFETKDE